MSDWLNDLRNREPDVVYTLDDGYRDGIFTDAGRGITITVGARDWLAGGPLGPAGLAERIRGLHDRGVYADPPELDPERECNRAFAMYSVGGGVVWVEPNGVDLTAYLPEER